MNNRPELDTWLDDTELTDDQRDAFYRAADMIDERYPVPADGTLQDVTDDREFALSGALQVILGEAAVEKVTSRWQAARSAEAIARASMTGAFIAATLAGESENGLMRRTGVTRTTIRKAVGK